MRLRPLALLLTVAIAVPAVAGEAPKNLTEPRPASAADTSSYAEGEVRRIDTGAAKITIRHGPIRNLDMPPMTMAFVVRDKALLARVKVGDSILFRAVSEKNVLVVTDIQPAK